MRSTLPLALCLAALLSAGANSSDAAPLSSPPCFPPGEKLPEKEAENWMRLACRAFGPSDAEIEAFLEGVLRPLVRKTPRATSFFHYGGRKHLKTQQGPLGLDAGQAYVDYAAKSHWDPRETNGEFGGALYAATDPLASQSYTHSGEDLLIRVGLPSGFTFLDLRKVHRSIPLSAPEARFASCTLLNSCDEWTDPDKKKYCADHALETLRDRTLAVKPFRDSTRLSPVLRRAYGKLGVSAILAGYGAPQYAECKVRGVEWMSDLVLTDPAAVPSLKIETFAPELENDPSPEKRRAYLDLLELMESSDPARRDHRSEETIQRADRNFLTYYRPWSIALRGDPPTADFLALHKQRSLTAAKAGRRPQETLFGCSTDPKFAAEKTPATRVAPRP